MNIHASIENPPERSDDFDERCNGPDEGLINSWLSGIEFSQREPALSIKAKAGELPVLPWKGGVEKTIKRKDKVGALQYLAAWQGLRGDDLNVELGSEVVMTCTRTGVVVTFTGELQKLLQSEEDGS